MIPAELLPAVAVGTVSVVALLLARVTRPKKRRYPNGSKNLVIVIDGKALTAQLS